MHIPSEDILAGAPDWFWSELILGDLSHSAVFDNSKVRRYVPDFAPRLTFHATVPEMLGWRAGHAEQRRPAPTWTRSWTASSAATTRPGRSSPPWAPRPHR